MTQRPADVLTSALLLALLAGPVMAQSAGQSSPGTITGVVYDSIARKPLAGALVQVVAVEGARHFSNSTISDSLGRYRLNNVPNGRFMLGFLHPLLDSLGLEPLLHEVVVDASRSTRSDLSIPSPARIRAAVCGAPDDSSHGGAVIGVVRSSRDRGPVAAAVVTAEWLELSLRRDGMNGRVISQSDTTGENGWFALCNVPSPGTILISAGRGADNTDRLEIDLTGDGFARRELYLGGAHVVTRNDSTMNRVRVGAGRLRGVVVAAENDRLLPGARVSIADGQWTEANGRGEWNLAEIPTGTRVLHVRAVGFYPQRVVVDVVDDAPTIFTELPTMKAVLDTVRVTASRVTRESRGFEERRRTGIGRFVTREDVLRRQPLVTSDIFQSVAGLRVERTDNPNDGRRVMMSGSVGDRCWPAIYIDGQYMSDLGADEIDTFVRPGEIMGIEVYSGPWAPVQFTRGMAGIGGVGNLCGSIVIWTQPSQFRVTGASWRVRALTVAGAGAIALLISAIVGR